MISRQMENNEVPHVELVDLVDSKGLVIERPVPRNKVEDYPDLHLQIVICVIFDKDGKVLVHKRAGTKKVNPSCIDHVCGGIKSGENQMDAVKRESLEETTLVSSNLRLLRQGVNKYNRYCFLFVGETNGIPNDTDPNEVEWVRFMSIDELREKFIGNELKFVDDFFEDLEWASLR